MTKQPNKAPHPGSLMKVIRRLAADDSISFTDHAFEDRRVERGIDVGDAREILRLGEIDGPVERGSEPGEWKCTVVGKLRWTTREAGVVTVVIRDERLLIITVEWMDP
jgi:hypothetical protein